MQESGDNQASRAEKSKVSNKSDPGSKAPESPAGGDAPSVTLVLRTKPSSSPEDTSMFA